MGGLLLALLLGAPDSGACRDALRSVPDTLARRAQVMVRACAPLISSVPCRESFARLHAVGQRPYPLRKVVSACWASYCKWDIDTPCEQPPAKNSEQLVRQWTALEHAIWRHEALVDADRIASALERGSWASDVTDAPIASLELHVQGDGVLLIACAGASERRWTMPQRPRDDDYASVLGWLMGEVRTSGLVAVAAEPSIRFGQVNALMSTLYAAGLPWLSFRLLR